MEKKDGIMGQIIRPRLKERGMTVAEFSRRISCSSQNVYDIFKRDDINLKQALRIQHLLDFDFINKYDLCVNECEKM
jgi:predicted transcriptional regulator